MARDPEVWSLDIDEQAIYFGEKRIALLDSGQSNDDWRAAMEIGQSIVSKMNEALPFKPEGTQK